MNRNILVYLQTDPNMPDFFSLSTYDRIRKRKSRFYISKLGLSSHLNTGTSNAYLEMDLNNLISINDMGSYFAIKIYWVSADCGDSFKGYMQRINVPGDAIRLIMNDCIQEFKFVYHPMSSKQAKIVNYAHRTIGRILRSSLQNKRAFSKAMRDSFNYPDSTIYLYDDGDDFYFEDFVNSKYCMNGGLVLHRYDHMCADGIKRPAIRYSVHT